MHFPPPATDKIGEPLHDASASKLGCSSLRNANRDLRRQQDWTDVHTVFDVNGHIQSRWIRSTGQWSRPELVRDPMLHIHGLAPVINYGQAAFEGLKAFRAPNGDVNIVRPEWHAARMAHSSALVSIPPLSEDHFLACIQLAVGHNAEYVPPHDCEGMLYIRPVVFGSGPSLALDPPDEFLFCVFVATAAALHGADPIRALVLDEFDRAAPRGTGSGKVAGNYAPVMRWSNVARHQGFDITLHLDSQTRTEIEEFSTSAFVGIKVATGPDGGSSVTLIVPDTKNIVNSVSCDSVQQLARSLGWRVERRPVKYEELSELTEVIACGTAVSIISIKSITRKSVSDEIIYGSTIYAQRLVTGLRQIYKGDVADRFDWLTQLERPADLDLHLKPSKTNGRMDSESSSLQLNGH